MVFAKVNQQRGYSNPWCHYTGPFFVSVQRFFRGRHPEFAHSSTKAQCHCHIPLVTPDGSTMICIMLPFYLCNEGLFGPVALPLFRLQSTHVSQVPRRISLRVDHDCLKLRKPAEYPVIIKFWRGAWPGCPCKLGLRFSFTSLEFILNLLYAQNQKSVQLLS